MTAGMGGIPGGLAGAGSAGMGTGAVAAVTCNYKPILEAHCASAGCHSPADSEYGPSLHPDDDLVLRLKDKPASHGGINCAPEGEPYEPCVPAACEIAAGDAPLLIDSANPDASWLLRKLRGLADGCGENMPMPPGDDDFSEARRACLEEFFLAVAAEP